MIPYLLHTSILLGGCYVFYWLLLRKETFFRLNRWVLLGSILLSVLLPLVTIPASWSIHSSSEKEWIERSVNRIISPVNEEIDDAALESPALIDIPIENAESATIITNQKPVKTRRTLSFSQIVAYLYFIGIGVFILAFLVQLFLLLAKIYSLNSVQDGKFRIVELVKDEAPYSFWNTIFINPTKYNFDTYEQIIAHEKIHIQQVHFFDKMLAELLVICFWFNPFAWLFRRAITNNLEYLTDENMLQQGAEPQTYQLSLLQVSVPQYALHLTTNYNQSFLKNRIMMMNAKKSSARSSWKYLFLLPLLGLSMICLNAFQAEPHVLSSDSQENSSFEHTAALANEETEILETEIGENFVKEEQSEPIGETNYAAIEKVNEIQAELAEIQAVTDTLPEEIGMPEPPEFPLSEDEMRANLENNPEGEERINELIEMYEEQIADWEERIGEYQEKFAELEQELAEREEELQAHEDELVVEAWRAEQETKKYQHWKEVIESDAAWEEKANAMEEKARAMEEEAEKMARLAQEMEEVAADYEERAHMFEEDGAHNEFMQEHQEEMLDDLKRKNKYALLEPANEYWKWPTFQAELIELLQQEGLLENENRFRIHIGHDGGNYFQVNHKRLWGDEAQSFLQFFNINDMPFDSPHEWSFYKNGRNIMILEGCDELETLREALVKALKEDGYIKSKKDKVELEIPGHAFLINGERMPDNLFTKYDFILHQHDIFAAPGKIITMRKDGMEIGVGYQEGRNNIGSWLFEN